MPGGDRTGPMGQGPRTGRAAGLCAGNGVPGYMNPGFGYGYDRGPGFGFGRGPGRGGGRGAGFGRGFGRRGGGQGWRHRNFAAGYPVGVNDYGNPYYNQPGFYTPPNAPQGDELAYLQEQAQYLKDALNDIESRVSEIQANLADSGKNQGRTKD